MPLHHACTQHSCSRSTDQLVLQAALPAVSHLDMDGLEALCASALEVIVAEQAGQVEAFLVLYGPGQEYASENYRWFCQRYADLVYIDRIVLAPSVQRQGLGRSLYNDAMAMASARQVPLVCEVRSPWLGVDTELIHGEPACLKCRNVDCSIA